MMNETYQEMKKRHEKEMESFPMEFAFSNDQLQKALNNLGATKNEVVAVGAGSIIRKKDKGDLINLLKRHDDELNEAMKNETFADKALRYELANHEYIISGDPSEALDVLGLSLEEVQQSPVLSQAL